MKIAYLVHTQRDYDEIVEMIAQLIKQNDHVYIMINDNTIRGEIAFVYAEDRRVHIASEQEFAQEGDMSLARGTLIEMKTAYTSDIEFTHYINLSDGMIPIKTRSEIEKFLTNHPNDDFYYVKEDETQNPAIRKQFTKYYPLTNLLAFPKGRFTRAFTRGLANIIYTLHIRRKNTDKIFIGSPWFILSHSSAKVLVENYDYCSSTFGLSWYAEEMVIPMMLNKYKDLNHINKDLRVVGLNGKWIPSSNCKPLTQSLIDQDNEALFGGSITADETPQLYTDYYDKYNQDIN